MTYKHDTAAVAGATRRKLAKIVPKGCAERILSGMQSFESAGRTIRMDATPTTGSAREPALVLLHGAGGAVSYWTGRFAPALARFGVGLYAPHYFDRTGTGRATPEMILDGQHFPQWVAAAEDAVASVARQPSVDPDRIAVLGISLGGYLAMALATIDSRLRAVAELSGGMPPGWEHRISSKMPPVLILHGEQDTIVPVSEARKLAQLLQAGGVAHQMELFPGESHWFSTAAQGRMLMSCAGFLSRHLFQARRAG